MTIKHVCTTVRAMGLTCVWLGQTKEFRVNILGAGDGPAYYTNDGEDAILTARAMIKHRPAYIHDLAGIAHTFTQDVATTTAGIVQSRRCGATGFGLGVCGCVSCLEKRS